MDEFKTWFFIGFEHIMDIQALDHTLFILALVVAYDSSQLKKIIFACSKEASRHFRQKR